MRKLFKERKLFKGGNYMRKYGNPIHLIRYQHGQAKPIFFKITSDQSIYHDE